MDAQKAQDCVDELILHSKVAKPQLRAALRRAVRVIEATIPKPERKPSRGRYGGRQPAAVAAPKRMTRQEVAEAQAAFF